MKSVRAVRMIGSWLLVMFCLPAVVAQTLPTYVKPGDTLKIPLPLENTNPPDGDTLNAIKVIVTGGSALVTSPTDSLTDSLAPGEVKTFTPSFVVGNVPDGNYTVKLKLVSSDAGIVPDIEDPSSMVDFVFTISAPTQGIKDPHGAELSSPINNQQNLPIFYAEDFAGISSVELAGPYSKTWDFPGCPTSVKAVPPPNLPVGNYTMTVRKCAGNPVSTAFEVVSQTPHIVFRGPDGTPTEFPVSRDVLEGETLHVHVGGISCDARVNAITGIEASMAPGCFSTGPLWDKEFDPPVNVSAGLVYSDVYHLGSFSGRVSVGFGLSPNTGISKSYFQAHGMKVWAGKTV